MIKTHNLLFLQLKILYIYNCEQDDKIQLNFNYDRNTLLCWLFKFLCKIIVKFTIDLKFVWF